MKKSISITFFIFISSLVIQAQMPQTVPLEDGDVEKFIKTYKPLTEELEALGESFEGMENYNALQTFGANAKVKAIFEKHGWDEKWSGKWITISMAYAVAKMQAEMEKLPADQRAQMAQYMEASSAQMKSLVTDGDLEKVAANMDGLNKVFDTLDEDY